MQIKDAVIPIMVPNIYKTAFGERKIVAISSRVKFCSLVFAKATVVTQPAHMSITPGKS